MFPKILILKIWEASVSSCLIWLDLNGNYTQHKSETRLPLPTRHCWWSIVCYLIFFVLFVAVWSNKTCSALLILLPLEASLICFLLSLYRPVGPSLVTPIYTFSASGWRHPLAGWCSVCERASLTWIQRFSVPCFSSLQHLFHSATFNTECFELLSSQH